MAYIIVHLFLAQISVILLLINWQNSNNFNLFAQMTIIKSTFSRLFFQRDIQEGKWKWDLCLPYFFGWLVLSPSFWKVRISYELNKYLIADRVRRNCNDIRCLMGYSLCDRGLISRVCRRSQMSTLDESFTLHNSIGNLGGR